MSTEETKKEYEKLYSYMQYTLHELPAGVLYGNDGASEEECKELMKETYRLEELSNELGIDISKFIEGCRWHYERYPHYISRYKHFNGYCEYITKHKGPVSVEA